jgi:hypothetical protein
MRHKTARFVVGAVWTAVISSMGVLTSSAAFADEPDHRIEIHGDAGPAVPASWYSTSRNQSVGLNVMGSVLGQLSWGLALGVGAEWSQLPWSPAAGPDAHVDTWILGPELRYTDHHLHRLRPSAYVGAGWGSVSPSRQSSCSEVSGGPAARAGIGIDLQLSRRWKLGASVGFVLQPPVVSSGLCDPAKAVNDPSTPEAPGNVWAFRLGGGGDFL